MTFPIKIGGTGAVDAAGAREALGVTGLLTGKTDVATTAALQAVVSAIQSGNGIYARTKAQLDANTSSLAGTVDADTDGTKNGTYGRTSPNDASTPWILLSKVSLTGIDARIGEIQSGSVTVGAARRAPRRRDYLGWGWKKYRYGILLAGVVGVVGGIDGQRRERRWDGLGLAEINYPVFTPDLVPLATQAVSAVAAQRNVRRRDYLGWGWKKYIHNLVGQIVGGKDVQGRDRRWDGLGLAQSNYPPLVPDVVPLATQAVQAQTATRYPRRRDYLGFGWPRYHYAALSGGAVVIVGGIDRAGQRRRWVGPGVTEADFAILGGAATTPLPILARAPMLGLSSSSRGTAFQEALRAQELLANPPDRSNFAQYPTALAPMRISKIGDAGWSADFSAYNQYVSRSICSGDQFARQWLRVGYGSNLVARGDSGEDHAYGTLYRTAVGTNAWEPIAFFIPSDYGPNTTSSIADMRINRLPDGRALITYPSSGAPSGKRMTFYAVILHNPETAGINGEPPDFGPQCVITFGWTGILARVGSDLLLSSSTTRTGWTDLDGATITGNRLYRLRLIGTRRDMIVSERISQIPDAPADQGYTDYYECSIAPLGSQGLIAAFRTREQDANPTVGPPNLQGGYWFTRNNMLGRAGYWSPPVRFPFPTVGSQTEITVDPDGDLVMAYNHSSIRRENPAIAISKDQGLTWSYLIFDPRGTTTGDPALSYFRLTFSLDVTGAWDGTYTVFYDKGRNKVADGLDPRFPPPDPNANPPVPAYYRGSYMVALVKKANLLSGVRDPAMTILEDPTYKN